MMRRLVDQLRRFVPADLDLRRKRASGPGAPAPREPRHQHRAAVAFGATKSLGLTGELADISRHGLCVLTRQAERVGTRLEVTVELPNHELAHVKATVRWVRRSSGGLRIPPAMGLTIVEADDAYFRLALALENRAGDVALEFPPRPGAPHGPATEPADPDTEPAPG